MSKYRLTVLKNSLYYWFNSAPWWTSNWTTIFILIIRSRLDILLFVVFTNCLQKSYIVFKTWKLSLDIPIKLILRKKIIKSVLIAGSYLELRSSVVSDIHSALYIDFRPGFFVGFTYWQMSTILGNNFKFRQFYLKLYNHKFDCHDNFITLSFVLFSRV